MNKPNSSLSQFIEEYPLYSKFGVDQPIEAADLNNLAFNFFCKKEKEIQAFRLEPILHNSNGIKHNGSFSPDGYLTEGSIVDFTEMFTGVCQSCESYKIKIIISGASQKEKPKYFIRKIGQYPAPESSSVKLPADVVEFLDETDLEGYTKGLKNLEWGCGTGAFAYFRRMAGNVIEKIIEILSDPYSPHGNQIVETFSNYVELRQKTKFIEDITPHLPKSLQEHGANIFLVLYDAASIEMNGLTEKECLKKSKDIDTLLRYLARKINAERHEAFSGKNPNKYFFN